MRLTHLSLTNFRNFTRLDIDVPDGTVLIVGSNAQGKTSILEAIYFLSTFTSFHALNDRQLINFIEARNPLSVGRIVADFERAGRLHHMEVRIIQERGLNGSVRTRKEALLDGSKKRLGELVGTFSAVLFLPQMMQIVDGSPGDRRRYLDMALSQVLPNYAINLSEYNKVLSQRNALLKQINEQGGDQKQLDFWDERLALRGAEIIYQRIQAVQELDKLASIIHHQLARGDEVLRLDYIPSFEPLSIPEGQKTLLDTVIDRSSVSNHDIERKFLDGLRSLRPEELARGVTTVGPHRDDLRFLGNGVDLGIYGSRGQIRTVMLSLKMAEVEWVRDKVGYLPVLLLDEVLAELDQMRREDLLARVAESEQTLMTTTDLNLFLPEFIEKACLWKIQNGRLETS
jgi:DNA replication and repair protein RecF